MYQLAKPVGFSIDGYLPCGGGVVGFKYYPLCYIAQGAIIVSLRCRVMVHLTGQTRRRRRAQGQRRRLRAGARTSPRREGPKQVGRSLVASPPSERRHSFEGKRGRFPRVVPNKLGSIAVLPGY